MKDDVLNPVRTVKIRGQDIEVKELTWKDYLRAVKDLTGSVIKLFGQKIELQKGEITLNRDRLIEIIGEQETLVQWVLEKSTGQPKEFIAGLSAREVFPLIEAVVDLNLSEEVTGPGKMLAGRMGDILGLKKVSVAPSITSSAPATPSATSKG